jgi:hypothetical protein
MVHPFPASDLLLGSPDFLEQFGALHESLILRDVEENGAAPAVLREYEGTTGCAPAQ